MAAFVGILPTNIAGSIAGAGNAHQAQRGAPKAAPKPREAERRRREDEVIIDATQVDGPEAVRQSKNSDQEAREDEERRRHYQPGTKPTPDDKPRLDVAG